MSNVQASFKHIVIATDFGEPSEHAVEVGLAIAAKFDATVTLLHAVWIPPLANAYVEGLPWPVDAYDEAAKKGLSEALAKAKALHPKVESKLIAGEPARTIIETSRDEHADLLVLGTHGRRGLSHVVMGSVAERVVRQSEVPVLTVGLKKK
ncbi:MAG: universal stress protein [Polyangiaceae bacterium]